MHALELSSDALKLLPAQAFRYGVSLPVCLCYQTADGIAWRATPSVYTITDRSPVRELADGEYLGLDTTQVSNLVSFTCQPIY